MVLYFFLIIILTFFCPSVLRMNKLGTNIYVVPSLPFFWISCCFLPNAMFSRNAIVPNKAKIFLSPSLVLFPFFQAHNVPYAVHCRLTLRPSRINFVFLSALKNQAHDVTVFKDSPLAWLYEVPFFTSYLGFLIK